MLTLASWGCGAHKSQGGSPIATDLARTRPLGPGAAFRPPAIGNPAVAAADPVGAMRCRRRGGKRYGAHIELFARNRGLLVPAGIGIAPPQRRRGAFVEGGRCTYPVRTLAPTGVVEVDPAALRGTPTVGELFSVWGQPLTARRLAGFTATSGSGLVAFIDGRRWVGDPRAIPLRRHAQIVMELEASVSPHSVYAFPQGL
jgi:hypothetical protein